MSASKIVLRILRTCIGLLILVLVLFALIRLGTTTYDIGYRIFTEEAIAEAPGRDAVVEVTEGMSAGELGTALEEKGLVRSGTVFMLQSTLFGYNSKLQPGLYTLNTSETPLEMLQLLTTVEEEDTKAGEE